MGWGEQAQIAVDQEFNPPKGPGGNPKVDRRSTTGSNFMRCLPDQTTSLTQLTSDRKPFLGGLAAVVQPWCQRRKSKFGMRPCRAENNQHVGWAEVGVADESEGTADGSVWPYQDSMLMSHADGGSHLWSQACAAGQMTNSILGRSDNCSSSFSGQSSGFVFNNRHHGQGAAGHCCCAVNSRVTTGADSKFSHASKHSMLSSISSGMSCGCSHHSSSGRSCRGSQFMLRHIPHDCVSSLRHDKLMTPSTSSVQQAQSCTQLSKAPVLSHIGHNVAAVPSRLVQNRLLSRAVLSSLSNRYCGHKHVQGIPKSCAQQRLVATRLWL